MSDIIISLGVGCVGGGGRVGAKKEKRKRKSISNGVIGCKWSKKHLMMWEWNAGWHI